MASKKLQKGQGTVFTIVLPGIGLSEEQRKEVLKNFEKVLNGEAVPANRDSVCVGVGTPISVSYCWDV